MGQSISTGEPQIVITHEMPLSVYPWPQPIPKEQVELIHINQFGTDYALLTGTPLYTDITAGPNPPDFVAATPEGTKGIDCVQFTVPNRRGASAKAEAIRRTLFEAGPNRFAHLRGFLVYVWAFDEEGAPGLPLRATERADLLDRLAAFRYTPGDGTMYGPEFQAPELGIEYTASGWGFYATPFLMAAPLSSFFSRMGFELAFVYNSTHSITSLWDELGRLIQQHNNPDINELLFTVGGPDRSGFIHPAEEAILDFILSTPLEVSLPRTHLQRALIHGWDTGRIIQIYPEFNILHAGTYKGIVPAHRPVASS